jgi:hypothetical protein
MTGSIASLIPAPLHPAVVHLPMALAVLVPLFAIGAIVAIRRGARPMRAWGVALAMFGALSLSSWVSLETGEQAQERVENSVPRPALHAHNDAAEQFMAISVGVLFFAGVGVLSSRTGSAARAVATFGSVVLLVAGYRVGHTGGALVYAYGAGSAFASGKGANSDGAAPQFSIGRRNADGLVADRDDDDDDDDDDDNANANAPQAGGAATAAGLVTHVAVPLPDSVIR